MDERSSQKITLPRNATNAATYKEMKTKVENSTCDEHTSTIVENFDTGEFELRKCCQNYKG